MHLGAHTCFIKPGTCAYEAYGTERIRERHRHRYEVNLKYLPRMEEKGLLVSGRSEDGKLVKIIELKDHPWFVATQFHPEFKSQPLNPHPLFKAFVGHAIEKQAVPS